MRISKESYNSFLVDKLLPSICGNDALKVFITPTGRYFVENTAPIISIISRFCAPMLGLPFGNKIGLSNVSPVAFNVIVCPQIGKIL